MVLKNYERRRQIAVLQMKRVTTIPYCKEERETHFWHAEIDGDVITVETSERYWNTKLKKQGWHLKEEGRTADGRWVYSVYEAPIHALSIRSSVKVKREMTEEQRQAARERMANIRKKKDSKAGSADV